MSDISSRRRAIPQATVSLDFLDKFQSAITAAGLTPPEAIEPDGRLHRFSGSGKRGDDAAWYVLHGDGVPAGAFGCWRSGISQTWRADIGRALTHTEEAEQRARIEAAQRAREAEEAERRTEARATAEQVWKAAVETASDHAYLRGKAVAAIGIRAYRGARLLIRDLDCANALVVPIRDAEGVLHSLQFIGPDGEKRYLPGGRVHGCYFGMGKPPKAGQPLAICEGYATAASVHAATGYAAVVAFDAGNLGPVAAAIRRKYPQADIVICADNDIAEGKPNVGVQRAREAAQAVGARLVVPELGGAKCDFNDLAQAKGPEAVRGAIQAALPHAPAAAAAPSGGNDAPASLPSTSNAPPPDNPAPVSKRPPLDWLGLTGKEPPARRWAIKGWLGFGHTTLLVGSGGIGKTLIAQQAASALALGSSFIDEVPGPIKVLMWACEDDHDELWRRQVSIARWLDAPLDTFAENLVIVPRHGLENALVATEYGRPMFTPMLEELREQAGDYGAGVVILDNAAQLYGGSENDRHAVTMFLNALAGVLPGRAVMLLAHPARSAGSEFSGSSAWENTARTRLYLGTQLPDQKAEADEQPQEDVRYLARRKANYSTRDWRRFMFKDGVLVPDAVEAAGSAGGIVGHLREQAAERIVLAGLQRLQGMGIEAAESSASPQYLPRLLADYKLAEGRPRKELAEAMRRLRIAGQIDRAEIGKYANRSTKYGLRVVG